MGAFAALKSFAKKRQKSYNICKFHAETILILIMGDTFFPVPEARNNVYD